MFKGILILIVFAIFIASLKPTPSVEELTRVSKIYCKDICK
jgi:hypothetical protein